MNFNSVHASFIAQIHNYILQRTPMFRCYGNRLCKDILLALQRDHIVKEFKVSPEKNRLGLLVFEVTLHHINNNIFLRCIMMISKPGRRIYAPHHQIDKLKGNGFNRAILSTNSGVLTCQECKDRAIGGELLAKFKV